ASTTNPISAQQRPMPLADTASAKLTAPAQPRPNVWQIAHHSLWQSSTLLHPRKFFLCYNSPGVQWPPPQIQKPSTFHCPSPVESSSRYHRRSIHCVSQPFVVVEKVLPPRKTIPHQTQHLPDARAKSIPELQPKLHVGANRPLLLPLDAGTIH